MIVGIDTRKPIPKVPLSHLLYKITCVLSVFAHSKKNLNSKQTVCRVVQLPTVAGKRVNTSGQSTFMSRFSKARVKWFESGVNDYVAKIRDRICSKDEVFEYGETFQLVHSEFRRKALAQRWILKQCLELLTSLQNKEVRWDYVFEVSMKQTERLKAIRDAMPELICDLDYATRIHKPKLPQGLVERLDSTGIRTGHFCRWLFDESTNCETLHKHELYRAHQRYADAKRDLASTCLMLVIKIAHQFRDTGSRLMELIQDGNIGVMIAAEKYDPRLGWTFSAYASHWIKRCIFIGLGQRGMIRIPDGKMAEVNRCLSRIAEVSQELGRKISYEERTKVLDDCKLNEPVITTCCCRPVSLTQFAGHDQTDSPYLVVSRGQTDCPVNSLLQEELRVAVEKVVGQFADRERTIIEMRFGLNGKMEHSLASIAEQTGLTHQRIHQIIAGLKSQLRIHLEAYR